MQNLATILSNLYDRYHTHGETNITTHHTLKIDIQPTTHTIVRISIAKHA